MIVLLIVMMFLMAGVRFLLLIIVITVSDRSVHTGISCNDLAGDVFINEVVHDDGLFDCNDHVLGPPIVLTEALYSTSDFKHIYHCSVNNCTSCVTIHSSLLASLHASLCFLPASSLTLPPPIPVPSASISSPPSVVSSLSSYISVQSFYSGSPNFISKVAHVASHINFKLLGELSQGFHVTQILD
jgi:hypothetical protein